MTTTASCTYSASENHRLTLLRPGDSHTVSTIPLSVCVPSRAISPGRTVTTDWYGGLQRFANVLTSVRDEGKGKNSACSPHSALD
jgi:hypothetical protein